MKRKILSWALCLCMALTWIPASALASAEDDTPPAASTKAASVKIGDDTKEYDTFMEAWTAATDPNINTARADAVITLLKDGVNTGSESGSGSNPFALDTNQAITLNIPKGMTLTVHRGFSVGGGQSLTINGNPTGEQSGNNGKIVASAASGDPGLVSIGSDAGSTLTIQNCDLESNNGPAVFGGGGTVTISGSKITSKAVATDYNRTAAVSVSVNPGVSSVLNISNENLT